MKQFRYFPRLKGVSARVGSVFGLPKNENGAVDVGDEGEPIFKEDIIAFVKEKLDKAKRDKMPFEWQWTLNSNFIAGNQFCDINLSSGDVEEITPEHDYLEREVFNQISPIIDTRIANLKKINYKMKVNPRTDDIDDYQKADVSTKILKYLQSTSSFEEKKNTCISWNEICGNCFFLSWWDKNKGDKFAVEYKIEIDENGNEKKTEIAHFTGDVDYGLLTPYEIYPEDVYKQTVKAQRYIIVEQVKSVEDVKDLYDLKIDGSSVETFQLTPTPLGGGQGYENTTMMLGHRSVENAARVVTYFERPSRHRPNGRMIIIINDEHLVYYGRMPYDDIPIVQTICREVPGQFFGKSVIEDLIPRQRAYNGCMNKIHEYIKRVCIQSYVVPEGSIEDIDEFIENGCAAGEVTEYNPALGPPVPMSNGVLPNDILNERYQLVRDMEYVAGVSQLMTSGSAPTGVTSGVAIEAIKATDDTRLSLTGDYIRNSVKALAEVWLRIYKRHANVKRVSRIAGFNSMADTVVWSADDITSFDIEYTTENELLYTDEMQKQRFTELYNMGMFTDENGRIPEQVKHIAIEAAKIGNYKNILSVNTLQIQYAQRENTLFERGILPEMTELDNDSIHYEEHMKYALQMNFTVLKMKKPELAEAFIRHIQAHKQNMEKANMPLMMPELMKG